MPTLTAQTIIDSRCPTHPHFTINFGKVLASVLAGIALAADAYGNQANIPIDVEQFVAVFTQTWFAPHPAVAPVAPVTLAKAPAPVSAPTKTEAKIEAFSDNA
jgi:hypothetical protein